MSIASRLEIIESHLKNGYNSIEKLVGKVEEDKNIDNISKILDNLWEELPKVESTSSSAILNNTRKGGMELWLKGNTYQYTTTGKNKYGITSAEARTYGSGLPTGTTTNLIIDSYDLNNIKFHTVANGNYCLALLPTYQLESDTSYTLSYTRTNTLASGASARRYIYSVDDNNTYALINNINSGDSGDMSYTFTTTSTGKIALAFGFYNNASINSSEITNLMVRLSTESNVYEPYTNGPSPTLDYPQDVQTVAGHNDIFVYNQNVFNLTNYNNFGNKLRINGNASFTTTKDKIIITTGSNSTNSGVYIKPLPDFVDNYNSEQLYRISFNVKANRSLSFKYGYGTVTTTIGTNLTRLYNDTLINSTSGLVFYSTSNHAGDIIEISNITISPIINSSYPSLYSIDLENLELGKVDNYQDNFIRTSGKNLLPTDIDSWEQGTITNSSGENDDSTTRIRTKGYIPFKNDTNYYISVYNTTYSFLNIIFYDSDKNFIGTYYNLDTDIAGTQSMQISVSSTDIANIAYARVTLKYENNTSTITANEIVNIHPMINFGTIALPYEPYGTDEWYLKKETGSVILNGTETSWTHAEVSSEYATDRFRVAVSNRKLEGLSYCNSFAIRAAGTPVQDREEMYCTNNYYLYFSILRSRLTTDDVAGFKTWLNTHNTEVEYVLEVPTYTKITGTLATQLETVWRAYSYDTQTNIIQTNADAPFIIDVKALKKEIS